MIIHRVGHPPLEIRRGDRVSYQGENVRVRGISEARKMVRIRRDGRDPLARWARKMYEKYRDRLEAVEGGEERSEHVGFG